MFEHDEEKISRIVALKRELGEDFPRIGILVVLYNGAAHIASVLKRIHPKMMKIIEEIYVVDDFSKDNGFEVARRLKSAEGFDKLRVYRNPRNYGYGGNQKIGYQYALDKGFDYVLLLHGDGQYAPEYIPNLLEPALFDGKEVVFGSRMLAAGAALHGGMPLYKYIGNRILSPIQNIILSMRLSEFHSGYRLYSMRVLKETPFFLNSDDFHFDTQIIVQCRALGVDICEVPIPTYYGQEICRVNGIKYACNVLWSVLEYRLHQLHIVRRERYQVRSDSQYKLKRFRHSSHRYIIDAIRSDSKVLDLGCGSGFVAKELTRKGCKVVGIDNVPPEQVDNSLHRFIKWDLANLQDVPLEECFDYVVWGDVLEHLRNAEEALKASRRFLKESGRMILSTGNIAIWFYRLSLLLGRFNYGGKGILDKTHVRLYTRSSFESSIERAGLKIIDRKYTTIPFELVFESVRERVVVRLLDEFYYLIVKAWPRLFAYQCVVEAVDAGRMEADPRLEFSYVRHALRQDVSTRGE
ncbi:bifunctional glycosyltransferase/class I SAM-dependent methyltransferase [Acidobacteria bacterium AH-259-O06]|nr:bifunctional glycosyltransferase/class I SAM-dependent methyltransferase [Acidobacteria bacterium AH-259-O06]